MVITWISTGFHPIYSGVPEGNVLGSILLHLLYIADLPTVYGTTIAIYADDTVVFAAHNDPATASHLLQESLDLIKKWLITWRIKANKAKSIQMTFTSRKKTCSPVSLNVNKFLRPIISCNASWQKIELEKTYIS